MAGQSRRGAVPNALQKPLDRAAEGTVEQRADEGLTDDQVLVEKEGDPPAPGGLIVLDGRMVVSASGDARLPAKLQAQSRLLREARVPGLPKLLDVGRQRRALTPRPAA